MECVETLSLNGTWQCTFPDGTQKNVAVPGCFDAVAGRWDIGGPVDYQRSFLFTDNGYAHARLCFEGVSYFCQVWLNETYLGSHEGIWDSFAFDATSALRQGENILRLSVQKPGYYKTDSFPLRQVLSGFIPDVLCTFGGIWDEVRLETAASFFVREHHGEGDCKGVGQVGASLMLMEEATVQGGLRVLDEKGQEVWKTAGEWFLSAGKHELTLPVRLENPALWSLRAPHRYQYEWTLCCGGQTEMLSRFFGFREITKADNRLLLNGEPIYLRGILHWGYYDEALIPNPTEAEIRDELEKMRAFGFNTIKHCLYIPRRRYFDLMDEYGMLAWVELPLWLPEPTPELNPRIRREYPRILQGLQGHPSIGLLSLGCELDDSVDATILEDMYHLAQDSLHALVRDNSGSGECYGGLAVDFADFFDYHFYGELPNMEQLMETFTPAWRNTRPWAFGEFCDSDTLRDLLPVRRRKGVEELPWERGDPQRNPISALKPDFYAGHHEERMEKSGIRKDFHLLERLSRNHSLVHRKTTLEQTRSFPAICGYNVTNMRDVPIATSGLLDECMEPKFDPALFHTFNGDLMLLPAWDLTRVWMGADRILSRERYNFTSGSEYALHVLASNYGGENIEGATLCYALGQEDRVLSSGEILCGPLPNGQVTEAGYLRLSLPETGKPLLCKLRVALHQEEKLCENEFPIFIYPKLEARPALCVYDPCGALPGIEECFQVRRLSVGEKIPGDTKVLVVSLLDDNAMAYLREGGKVVLVQTGDGALPVIHVPMWREGMLRAFEHPIFQDMPQVDWQDDLRYFSMTTDVAFDTDRLSLDDLVPVLRRYNCRQWTVSDYLLTFTCGAGRCAATTLRLGGGMGKASIGLHRNPLAAYLLERMLKSLDQ